MPRNKTKRDEHLEDIMLSLFRAKQKAKVEGHKAQAQEEWELAKQKVDYLVACGLPKAEAARMIFGSAVQPAFGSPFAATTPSRSAPSMNPSLSSTLSFYDDGSMVHSADDDADDA